MDSRSAYLIFGIIFFLPPVVIGAEEKRPAATRWERGEGTLQSAVENIGPMYLVQVPEIREMLKLTAAQLAELDAYYTKTQEKFTKLVGEDMRAHLLVYASKDDDDLAAQISDEARIQRFAQHRTECRRLYASYLKTKLTPSQWKWLQELTIQLIGPLALANREIQDSLNMNPLQREEIESILGRYRSMEQVLNARNRKRSEPYYAKQSEAPPHSDPYMIYKDPTFIKQLDAAKAERDRLRTKAEQDLLRQLTRRQRERFQKMQGEPSELVKTMAEPGSFHLVEAKDKRIKSTVETKEVKPTQAMEK